MAHVLKMTALKRSAPIAMLIGLKSYDSTFHRMHLAVSKPGS